MKKFRVWDKQSKSYRIQGRYARPCCYYSFYIGPNGKLNGVYQNTNGEPRIEELSEEDFVLQFSTGLFDKNGREIYEGDIIQHEFMSNGRKYTLRQEIKWTELAAGDDMDLDSYGYHINPTWHEKFEVVGNVFESPV